MTIGSPEDRGRRDRQEPRRAIVLSTANERRETVDHGTGIVVNLSGDGVSRARAASPVARRAVHEPMLRAFAQRAPVALFYALALGIGWAGWLPVLAPLLVDVSSPWFRRGGLVLYAASPALAAVIVRRLLPRDRRGRPVDVRFRFRERSTPYGLAALLPIVVLAATRGLDALLPLVASPSIVAGDARAVLQTFVLSVLANPCEEIGWRGFALSRLEERRGPVIASAIVGVMTGLWHAPLLLWPESPMSSYPFAAWLAGTVSTAFAATWLYEASDGSLLVVSLYHVALNTASASVGITTFARYATASCTITAALWTWRRPTRVRSS